MWLLMLMRDKSDEQDWEKASKILVNTYFPVSINCMRLPN